MSQMSTHNFYKGEVEMFKRCKNKECDNTAEGSVEEVSEVFRYMTKDSCFRNVCKACEYKHFKETHYVKPSLRSSDYNDVGEV